jgi:UDP-N-acetylglucosamine 3-dehydrogenase
MMKSLQIGLVGCGSFAESHLRALKAIPNVAVTAVFDLNAERANQVAAKFDIPRSCKSLDEICHLSDLAAIDVITNEAAHADAVIAAVQAGKHAFVEKPFATTLDDCDRMIAAAEECNRILMVGHVLRFETRYAMLKESIDSGLFGTPISFHARRNRPKQLLETHARTHPVLLSSIHDIDFILWCVPDRVSRVRGYARKLATSPQIDTFWGMIEFENGIIACVETHTMIPGAVGIAQDDALQIVGDQGMGKLQLAPGTLAYWTSHGSIVPDVGYESCVLNTSRGALREELAYFVDCIAHDRSPMINRGIDGRRAVEVALALIKSSESDCEIDLHRRCDR